MLKRVRQPQQFFKIWAARAAIGLITVIAISSSVNAETYTLAKLAGGESFTVGGVTFFGWTFADDSTVNPVEVTIDTIDDPNLPGFRVNGNNELVGDDKKLIYSFSVSTTSALMAGALLWLTDYQAQPPEDVEIAINLKDDSVETDLEVEVGVGREVALIDAAALSDHVAVLTFDAKVTTDLDRGAIGAVNIYETRIILPFAARDPVGFLPGGVYLPTLLH